MEKVITLLEYNLLLNFNELKDKLNSHPKIIVSCVGLPREDEEKSMNIWFRWFGDLNEFKEFIKTYFNCVNTWEFIINNYDNTELEYTTIQLRSNSKDAQTICNQLPLLVRNLTKDKPKLNVGVIEYKKDNYKYARGRSRISDIIYADNIASALVRGKTIEDIDNEAMQEIIKERSAYRPADHFEVISIES